MVAEDTVEVQMNWQELLNRMAHWQRTQFTKATCESALAHVKKEVNKELTENPNDPEEWADLLHLAIQGGVKASGSLNKFRLEVQQKLAKNEDRQWPAEPDAENVYEHLKMDTAEESLLMPRKTVKHPSV